MGETKKRVVVLGGGFAGVECTRQLERRFRNDDSVEIVMVSEDNFLLFTPMLPQVASGMIEARNIVMPIRAITKKAAFHEGRVKGIDPYEKRVNLWGSGGRAGASIRYNYLVVALGSETNFFGLSDLEKNAYQMKTLNDAVLVRNRIIDMLEHAENEDGPVLKKSLLTFVVVGGGFAGVETAGEVMDLLLDATKYYPNISAEDVRVIVLEALPGILPGFSEGLAKFAQGKLARRGVDIRLRSTVVSFDGTEVVVKRLGCGDGPDSTNRVRVETIPTRTVIWTAGVTPVNTIKRSLFKTEEGKIVVNGNLEVGDFSGVFAIGDCALSLDPETGSASPPTAQVAEAQAKVAAHNLQVLISGRGRKRGFRHKSKGQMAIIGKRTGVALVFGMNIHGLLAWFLWRNVYLSKIPMWNKRFRVFLDWVADALFDRDVSRLKFVGRDPEMEYRGLDELDDVW